MLFICSFILQIRFLFRLFAGTFPRLQPPNYMPDTKPRSHRNPLPERICPWCKESYVPYREWQKVCSKECRQEVYFATHRITVIPLGTSVPNLAESGSPDIDNPPKQNN